MASELFTDQEIEFLKNESNPGEKYLSRLERATNEEELRRLIRDEKIYIQTDTTESSERRYTKVQRTLLEHDVISTSLKKEIGSDLRKEDVEEEIFVPNSVNIEARAAFKTGKPIVLYGPTGTGKTTFAQQLADELCIDYLLATATPDWTSKDITGGLSITGYNNNQPQYDKDPGCVSEAVQYARDFDGPFAVIIDELTRADISTIFGELYTAIENPSQTIFETSDGTHIELDENVHIIATMNMSDRTVNELDDAITRRFAMVNVQQYPDDKRRQLFEEWITEYNTLTQHKEQLIDLFEKDLNKLNGRGDNEFVVQFGPMHYKDVVDMVGQTLEDEYEEITNAINAAYRLYIIPRLLNTATLSEAKSLKEHYEQLTEETQNSLAAFKESTDHADSPLDLIEQEIKRRNSQIGHRT